MIGYSRLFIFFYSILWSRRPVFIKREWSCLMGIRNRRLVGVPEEKTERGVASSHYLCVILNNLSLSYDFSEHHLSNGRKIFLDIPAKSSGWRVMDGECHSGQPSVTEPQHQWSHPDGNSPTSARARYVIPLNLALSPSLRRIVPWSATAYFHMVLTQQLFITFSWIKYFIHISLNQKIIHYLQCGTSSLFLSRSSLSLNS